MPFAASSMKEYLNFQEITSFPASTFATDPLLANSVTKKGTSSFVFPALVTLVGERTTIKKTKTRTTRQDRLIAKRRKERDDGIPVE